MDYRPAFCVEAGGYAFSRGMLAKTLPFLSRIVCNDHMINGDVLPHET
jgi:hypothetical protein